MKAAIVESFAKPPRYGSFDDPVAEAGEVLVQVEAAGLHQIVKGLANGTHYGSTGKLPFVPGVDGVGATITLAGATLRSSGVELLGSGFGSASMQEIFAALAKFFEQAAKTPFVAKVQAAALRDVEALWNTPEHGARLVFQP